MRSDIDRLQDTLEAIERIEKHVTNKEAFEKDELVQTWVTHHLQILGESCRKVSEEFQSEHPEIPWKKIIGMRNILVHDYFAIDTSIVWSVVEQDLPNLKAAISKLI